MANSELTQHVSTFNTSHTNGDGHNLSEVLRKMLGDKLKDYSKENVYIKGDIIYRKGIFYKLNKSSIPVERGFHDSDWDALENPAEINSVLVSGIEIEVNKSKNSDNLGGKPAAEYTTTNDMKGVKDLIVIDKSYPILPTTSPLSPIFRDSLTWEKNNNVMLDAKNSCITLTTVSGGYTNEDKLSGYVTINTHQFFNNVKKFIIELGIVSSGDMILEISSSVGNISIVNPPNNITKINKLTDSLSKATLTSSNNDVKHLYILCDGGIETNVKLKIYNVPSVPDSKTLTIKSTQIYNIDSPRQLRPDDALIEYSTPIIKAGRYDNNSCGVVTTNRQKTVFYIMNHNSNLLVDTTSGFTCTSDLMTMNGTAINTAMTEYVHVLSDIPRNVLDSNCSFVIKPGKNGLTTTFELGSDLSSTYNYSSKYGGLGNKLIRLTFASYKKFIVAVNDPYNETRHWVEYNRVKYDHGGYGNWIDTEAEFVYVNVFIEVTALSRLFTEDNLRRKLIQMRLSTLNQEVSLTDIQIYMDKASMFDHGHDDIKLDGDNHRITFSKDGSDVKIKSTTSSNMVFENLDVVARNFKLTDGTILGSGGSGGLTVERCLDLNTMRLKKNEKSIQRITPATLNIPMLDIGLSNSGLIAYGFVETTPMGTPEDAGGTTTQKFLQRLYFSHINSKKYYVIYRTVSVQFPNGQTEGVISLNAGYWADTIPSYLEISTGSICSLGYESTDPSTNKKIYINTTQDERTYKANSEVMFMGKDNQHHSLQDLFQSAVDGKQALVNEINRILGPSSGVNINSSWSVLINKLKSASPSTSSSNIINEIILETVHKKQSILIIDSRLMNKLNYNQTSSSGWVEFKQKTNVYLSSEVLAITALIYSNKNCNLKFTIYKDGVELTKQQLIDNLDVYAIGGIDSNNSYFMGHTILKGTNNVGMFYCNPRLLDPDCSLNLLFYKNTSDVNIHYLIHNKNKLSLTFMYKSATDLSLKYKYDQYDPI